MKIINFTLTEKSIKKAQNKLKDLKKTIHNLQIDFAIDCLEWVRDRAILYFKERTKKFKAFFSNIDKIETWVITSLGNNTYELRCASDIAAYIEFGTGIVGQQDTNNRANQVGWNYDVNGHGEEGWTFYNKQYNIFVKGFTGYAGKSFLYDAFWDFFFHKEYEVIFEKYKDKYI